MGGKEEETKEEGKEEEEGRWREGGTKPHEHQREGGNLATVTG